MGIVFIDAIRSSGVVVVVSICQGVSGQIVKVVL